MYVEQITSAELAASRAQVGVWLRRCKWSTRACLVSSLLMVAAIVCGEPRLAQALISALLLGNGLHAWWGWHIDREQRRVMRLLTADVENLQRLAHAQLESLEHDRH